MIDFDSWTIAVYNTTLGSWISVTDDVRQNPKPRWNRGIMSNRPDDRVGNPGYFTFSLDNSSNNSAGLAGYYSPGHANCWGGWTTGLPVVLYFTFENRNYYKYFGRIIPAGIIVDPGNLGPRKVDVTCGDFMYRSQNHELDHLEFAQARNITYVVNAVNDNMPIKPLKADIATGIEVFPTVFDMSYLRTTAANEYLKSAMSEFAFTYVKGDTTGGETLVVENRATRVTKAVTQLSLPNSECTVIALDEDGNNIQDEDGVDVFLEASQAASFDNTQLEGMTVSYGKKMANRINAYVYPRKVVASATLYSLNKSFEIKAGETLTDIRVSYRDPDNLAVIVSGINMVTPVRTTHYTATAAEDGTGADMDANLTVTVVYGTEGATYTASNNHATDSLWVQTMTAIGDGVYTYSSIQSTRNDKTSQVIHGVVPMSLDFKYLSDVRKAQLFSDYVLGKEAYPRTTINKFPIEANADSMRLTGFLQLEPGEKATFIEDQSGVNGDYFIMGYDAEIIGGRYVRWYPVLSDDLGYSVTLTSVYGEDTYISPYYYTGRDTQNSFYAGTVGLTGFYNGLIKFDLSSIPATATILSADLILNPIAMGGLVDPTITVYGMKRAWVASEATWSIYSTGNSWSTAGGENTTDDRDLDGTGTLTFEVNDYSEKTIGLDTTVITDMIDGTRTSNGFMIKVSNNYVGFASFENETMAKRPRLVISYRE